MNNIVEFTNRPRIKPKETLHAETKRTIKYLIITLTAMIVVLGATFLATTSQSAQSGYTLEQEKLKNEHLKSANSDITTKITKSTTFSSIENNDKILRMQEAENKKYLTKEDNLVGN